LRKRRLARRPTNADQQNRQSKRVERHCGCGPFGCGSSYLQKRVKTGGESLAQLQSRRPVTARSARSPHCGSPSAIRGRVAVSQTCSGCVLLTHLGRRIGSEEACHNAMQRKRKKSRRPHIPDSLVRPSHFALVIARNEQILRTHPGSDCSHLTMPTTIDGTHASSPFRLCAKIIFNVIDWG
jgi:hypothetical protein